MRQLKKALVKKRLWLPVLIAFLFSASGAAAQNKVAVVPLFGDGTTAPVPKTGQTEPYAAGDDGDLERGVTWPTPRFTENGDGTVTDKLTGLIWLQNATCSSFFSGDNTGANGRNWTAAITAANSLADGYCGLTDSSSAGDWRLPNIRELHSLVDFSRYNTPIPFPNPFTGLQNGSYWSSTTYAESTDSAWNVSMLNGRMDTATKSNDRYMWPVRGGKR